MKNIVSIIIITLLLLPFLSCKDSNYNKDTVIQTKYDHILESKEIRVGYISYPPSFIVKPDGSKSGIFFDVIEKIGENLDLKIIYEEEVTWDGMIESIKQDKIDMVVTGIWPTSLRGKHVDFVDPLFYSVVKAYTQSYNTRFDNNILSINSPNVKISTIDGEMTSIIADFDFPKAQQNAVIQLTGVSQTLLDVKENKSDVTFVEPAIALEFASKNPNTIKEVSGVAPLRVFPNSMMLPKGATKLKSTLNIAIEELINNGFVDKVITKYEKYPNSFYRVHTKYQQPF